MGWKDSPETPAQSASQGQPQWASSKATSPSPPPLEVDPSEGMSIGEKLLVGAGATADRTWRGVRNLARMMENATPEQKERWRKQEEEEQATSQAYEAHHPGGWATAGEVAGDLALSAIPVARGGQVLTKAIGAIPKLARVAPAAGDVLANTAYSAATTPEDRGEAAAWGAGGTVVGRALPGAVSKLRKPITPGPEAQKLLDAGVQPTFGQVLKETNPRLGGMVSRAEDALATVPVAGTPLRFTRERAQESFQRATREAALPPGVGREEAESIDKLSDAFSTVYDNAVKDAQFSKDKNPFNFSKTELDDGLDALAYGTTITPQKLAEAKGAVSAVFDDIDPHTMHTPKSAHEVEKRLKAIAYKYKSSADPDVREYGNFIHQAGNSWKMTWRGALPKDSAATLKDIDTAYSQFIPVRRAGARGDLVDPEAYTPKQLLQAVRAGDKTLNKSRYIAGDMPQQELARAAERVLGSKTPDVSPGVKLTVGSALAGSPLVGLGVPAAIGTSALAIYGTPVVQKYLTGQYGKEGLAVARRINERFPSMTPKEQERIMQLILGQAGRASMQQGQ